MEPKEKKSESYDDILGLAYPRPTARPRMSLQDRAAQFSPFAALTGFEDCLSDSERAAIETLER